MSESLSDAVRSKVLLADGAVGTELLRLGLGPGGFGESWNIELPERVISVHKAYYEAVARLLTTNSFRGNRATLASHGLAEQVVEINRRAAELARTAVDGNGWVLGSIGPFGGFLEPLGPTSASEALSLFEEQARALLEGGADGIAIETMTAKEELEVAIRAARAAGAPLVVAMMTFGKTKNGYRTMMGVSPADAVEVASAAGADVVGSNCGQGLSMEEYAELVGQFRALTGKPVIIRPNAGQPDLFGAQVQYHQTPQMMADQICDLVRAGANIVGGCCGTTPEHIRLFGQVLRRL
jgi:5-methyltetrahydrofolate--homocysteine methyltransferase